MSHDLEKFKLLLEETYQWPDYYMFKFIVKVEHKDQVLTLLEGHEIEFKHSEKGNYISVTSRVIINHTDEVIEIYHRLKMVPGILSL